MQSRPVIREYYQAQSKDGLVHEISHLNTALIYWKPAKANSPERAAL
jgi:hypothetical protein